MLHKKSLSADILLVSVAGPIILASLFLPNASQMLKPLIKWHKDWDKIKHNTKVPKNVAPEEFWWFVKQVRKYSSRKTVIKAENGEYFSWLRLTYTDEFLHKLDMQLGTNELPFLSKASFDAEQKKRFLTKRARVDCKIVACV